jgi:hypothetical protein
MQIVELESEPVRSMRSHGVFSLLKENTIMLLYGHEVILVRNGQCANDTIRHGRHALLRFLQLSIERVLRGFPSCSFLVFLFFYFFISLFLYFYFFGNVPQQPGHIETPCIVFRTHW